MAKKTSKYNFEQVEGKLDILRNDLGVTKVLLGDGTYGDFPDVTQYVTKETLDATVETVVSDTVEAKVEESVREQVAVADNSAIDALFS